jgi:two-component system, LytTR family, sensor kinase
MSSSPLSDNKFRNAFTAGWLILVIMQGGVLHFWFELSWIAAFTDSVLSNFLLLVASTLVMNTLRYYMPRREKYLHIIFWCLLLASLWLPSVNWLLTVILKSYNGYRLFLDQSLAVRWSVGFLVLGASTLLSVVWYNWEEQKENEQRKRDAEKLAKEAELFKLRQQLQPHFLFNSLNSINALIGSRPQEARKMIQQLSDFLRGTLKKEEHQWVNLQEELQYLQLYLDIEKVRFANRLTAIIEADESTLKMKLPALLLQPIVENAIKFGLYDTTGEAIIRIAAAKEENNLVIRVENPFDPETSSPQKGTGFGLTSVQRRLYLLFGRADLLTTEPKENIFTTIVKVPQLPDQVQTT